MTLPLKISKTKKKLYDETWYHLITALSILSFFFICAFVMRINLLSWKLGFIEARIPSLRLTTSEETLLQDKTISRVGNEGAGGPSIDPKTMTFSISSSQVDFGFLENFMDKESPTSAKSIQSLDISDTEEDFDQITKIIKTKSTESSKNSIALIIPEKNLSMPLLLNFMSYLKETELFEHLVLAGGFVPH